VSAVKKKSKKKKGLIKGASTSALISIGVHVALLVIAGTFVAVKIVQTKQAKFVPPEKIERPKMNLKKTRVKMKKTSKPRSTSRITSKNVSSMTSLQLPEISSGGSGLSGGVGGYELVPDVSDMGLFGGSKSPAVGNDFVGTFYSLRYDRRGKQTDIVSQSYQSTIKEFVEKGWNPYVFAPYFRSPQKLYTTQIFIPVINSEFGPSFFGIPPGPDFDAFLWCVHYKGKIMRKEGGRYRFWGFGDDVLLVRVNGKVVLNASFGDYGRTRYCEWERHEDDYKHYLGTAEAAVGDWFELEPGVPVEMEVLTGELYGNLYCAYLLVEDEDEVYSKNQNGMPNLPIFKTAEIPQQIKDKIKYSLIVGEGDLESDLMFNIH